MARVEELRRLGVLRMRAYARDMAAMMDEVRAADAVGATCRRRCEVVSLELPAALAAVEAFLGRPFPDGDEDALVRLGDDHDGRPGDDHDGRPGADARVAGLGLKASAGLLLARKGVTAAAVRPHRGLRWPRRWHRAASP
ncbi:hypothetical protein GCM10020220_111610 [Nonomuraea rubra]|uniref:hypothetical protein n=1 Tax=Nonomuraea rubra TaxID=46180 RepID=UPI0031EACA36